MLGNDESIEISQTSGYAKERVKWESTHTRFGTPQRPYRFEMFPKRLDRATRGEKGPEFEGVTAQNETDEARYLSLGFHIGRAAALDALGRDEREHAILAAERNFEIHNGRLSGRAAAEVRAAEAEHGATHLPEIKAKPVRRRRGPNKPKPVAS